MRKIKNGIYNKSIAIRNPRKFLEIFVAQNLYIKNNLT